MADFLQIPGVIMIDPKFPHNVGAAIRACSCFGINSLVWTGSRVNPSKYERLPREERMKGYKHVHFRNNDRPFDLFPKECEPVCVEVFEALSRLRSSSTLKMLSTFSGQKMEEFHRLCGGSVTGLYTFLPTFV